MFNTLVQAFKNAELRKRIFFTLFAFVVFKIMTFVSVPLTDPAVLQKIESTSLLGFADALSGGALKNFSIIALGVSPYITASIVIQLLQEIIPFLGEWAKEGETGKAKIHQLTRYASLALAFVQALAMAIGFDKLYGGSLLIPLVPTPIMYVYIAIVMTAGTAAVLWLSDQITAKGIGNGTSMIIMAGIIASFPYMFNTLVTNYFINSHTITGYLKFAVIVLIMITIVVGIIFMQNATRKIPIQYANRANSATLSGKKDSHLPIKLNPSGVIPVIFASSLMSIPLTFAQFSGKAGGILKMIFSYNQPIGLLLYIILIYLFSFFYSFVQINPEKVAENLRKQGSYIPGVRPGKETENFIAGVLKRTTVVGATYLMIIAIIPIIFTTYAKIPNQVQVGGTSLLIVVGVAQELFNQIETKAKAQKYSGFIK